MTNQDITLTLKPILQHYQVEPHFIERVGKAYRVFSNKGALALKSIPASNGSDFIRNVQHLYQKGYNRIVPIYPTTDGRYGVLANQQLYYLMPWMSNEIKDDRDSAHQQLFRELARLHTLSVKETSVKGEDRNDHYENMKSRWEKEKEFLDEMIEECENKWYISPFELSFSLYYHDVSQAITYSLRKLKEWYEVSKENENARTVITHGKVSTEHFLYDERGYGYFINFENSKVAAPFHDLLPFMAKTLRSYPKRADDCIEWIYTYMAHFPLKKEEMLLFQAYLAHPGPIYRVIESYHLKSRKQNEFKYTNQLLKSYWQLKNTEYVVMRIEKIEKQKLEASQQAEQAQEEGASQ